MADEIDPVREYGTPGVISDLTRINVEINFTLDTPDVVLLFTTGGIGYLAKQVYQHLSTRGERLRELEFKNYEKLIDVATKAKATKIVVKVHKDVPLFFPHGSTDRTLAEDNETRTIEIAFDRAGTTGTERLA